jgi:hypothetical protein
MPPPFANLFRNAQKFLKYHRKFTELSQTQGGHSGKFDSE